MIRQFELVERVRSYDPNVDEALLNRAYVFSLKSHGTQLRASGDPYFSHPLEVAAILTDMKLDCDTIATALLHDTVEDTVATNEEIEELFGEVIAKLVDGVTKMSLLKVQTETERQAENFRKFVLAMSDDIRVLLVKLADRLHNMRTLHFIKKPEKRQRIAAETMEIYAPLAERIGMRELKDELEQLAFRELNPEALETVQVRLEFLRGESGDLQNIVIDQLKKTLTAAGIEAKVHGREKAPYSIWSKMQRDHIAFEQLSDVIAFRIIVDDTPTCYQALGIVHGTWSMIPGRFKDYVSTPKGNHYQSIHTTVIGPEQQRIEIQIRTQKMHDVADIGVAAHWSYKQRGDNKQAPGYRWLRELVEIHDHEASPEEYLEHTKLAMYQDRAFCFTPKGDLIPLPTGATPIDFAYAVHSDVGNTAVGAKVNGRLVPLRHELHNGDQVEILRSKAQKPSPRWENFAVTGKARSAVRRFIRHREQDEYAGLGRIMLERAFLAEKLELSDRALGDALATFTTHKLGNIEDLYTEVGQGHIDEAMVLEALYPGMTSKKKKRRKRASSKDENDAAMSIKGLTPGVAMHLGECCHPLPGDRIVGIREKGKGVIVHTIDCERLSTVSDAADRWIDVSWEAPGDTGGIFVGRVRIVVINERGSLAQITDVVSKQGGNISNIRFRDREPEFFTIDLDIEVDDVKHLTNISTALRALRPISSAKRVRG